MGNSELEGVQSEAAMQSARSLLIADELVVRVGEGKKAMCPA